MLEHKHLIVKGDIKWKISVNMVKTIIGDLVYLLGMELIQTMEGANPNVGYQGGEDCGVTGCALITTSHIVLHTWDNDLKFQLDLYSCKTFKPQMIIDYLDKMDMTVTDKRFFDRTYEIIDDE